MDAAATLEALEAELDDIARLLDAYGDAPSLLRMQARIVGLIARINQESPE